MSRILGLDVLRGLAIFLVLIWHWIPESYGINYLFNGKLGFNIFFVLSGYLISKGLYEKKETNLKRQLYRFYFKRFLRIFPIYYLLLIILVSIDYSYIRSVQGWYWFYGVNVLIDKTTDFVPYTIHFWSLSVEEQFYIFWPILFIFFAKIKQVHNKFLVAIFLSSILFHLFHSQVQPIYFLNSFLYFFSFAMGAFVYFNISLLKKKLHIQFLHFPF